jgi:hypothetical protein
MSINNLPAALQSVIQQGFLEREFKQPLRAKLGFRAIAQREPFAAGIGETITKTRPGLLPAITTPQSPAANSDITSGMTPQNYAVEQYTLGIAQYPGTMMLNVATARVAIASLFLQNAKALGEQAARSVDTLAQQALFKTYLGSNTFVRTTLGSAGVTINVDDVSGFQYTWNTEGQAVPVSSSFPVNVTVGSDVYSLTGVTVDGSNVSISPGGVSGTLTFATSVTVADGTAKQPVQSAVAPLVQRPYDAATGTVMAASAWGISTSTSGNGGKLTMQMLLNAKAQLSANGVMPVDETGLYHFYTSPLQSVGLFADPDFKLLFRGQPTTEEFRRGVVAEILGVQLIETNLNPSAAYAGVGTVKYGAMCGEGALVEGVFTRNGYAGAEESDDDDMIEIVDDIAHITREPLDALKQVVTQSWSYIGGFTVPSDITTNPNTIPTASNSAFKRGVMLESL